LLIGSVCAEGIVVGSMDYPAPSLPERAAIPFIVLMKKPRHFHILRI
jgi:hypothetical protein